MKTEVNEPLVKRLLSVVDAGLVQGIGTPELGKMCVEAAVCYAQGLPHSDRPTCVSAAVRELKIKLNDSDWSSNASRAKGMRRLAVAQLGTADVLEDAEFARRVARLAIAHCVPDALRAAASCFSPSSEHTQKLLDAADLCARDGTESAAWSARSAAESATDSAAWSARSAAWSAESAAWSARSARSAHDESLSKFAEAVVQILIEMKAPGAEFLYITEIPQ